MQEENQFQQNLPDHLQQYFSDFQYLKCEEHQNEDMTLICVDYSCQNYFQPLCSECLQKYHKGHKNDLPIKSLKNTLSQIQQSLFSQTQEQFEKNQKEQNLLYQIKQKALEWSEQGQKIQKLCEQMSQIYKRLFSEIQQLNQYQSSLYQNYQNQLDAIKGAKNCEELKKQLNQASLFSLYVNNQTMMTGVNDDKKLNDFLKQFDGFAQSFVKETVDFEKKFQEFQTKQLFRMKTIDKVLELGKWARVNACRRILMQQEKQDQNNNGFYQHQALTKDVKYDFNWSSTDQPGWKTYKGAGWYKQLYYLKCGDCETFCQNCHQKLPQQLQNNVDYY